MHASGEKRAAPGSAAFDSDEEETPFLNTGDLIDGIEAEATIFGRSEQGWQYLPLVKELGYRFETEPVVYVWLAPYTRASRVAGDQLAKQMLLQLFNYASAYNSFVLLALFHMCNPLIDSSFTLLQNLLSSLPSALRKRISTLMFVNGGLSLKLLLNTAKASDHFWNRKFKEVGSLQEVLTTVSITNPLPVGVLMSEGLVPSAGWNPVTALDSGAHFVQVEEGVQVPQTVAQLLMMMSDPAPLRHRAVPWPAAHELYEFINALKAGEPILENPSDPAVVTAALNTVFATYGALLGEQSWDSISSYCAEGYEPTHEVLLAIMEGLDAAHTLVMRGVSMWVNRWLMSAQNIPHFDSPELFLSQILAPLLVRPARPLTPADAPTAAFANLATFDLLVNVDALKPLWDEIE